MTNETTTSVSQICYIEEIQSRLTGSRDVNKKYLQRSEPEGVIHYAAKGRESTIDRLATVRSKWYLSYRTRLETEDKNAFRVQNQSCGSIKASPT